MVRLAVALVVLLVLAPAAAATIPPPRDPLPALSIEDVATHETNFDTVAVLEVTLSPPTDDTVTVHWATADGTADSTDYVPSTGTLTFGPRQTSARIVVPIKGDALDEPDETIFVDLSDANFATIERGRGTVTIVDDDPAPFRLLEAFVDARWSVHDPQARERDREDPVPREWMPASRRGEAAARRRRGGPDRGALQAADRARVPVPDPFREATELHRTVSAAGRRARSCRLLS